MHQLAQLAVTATILTTYSCSLIAVAQNPESDDSGKLKHFESKIRPVLIKHCQECHATDTERSGGLLLDSATGWQQGGDSGAAIVVGQADASPLIRAITYADPKLQMPPDGKLPAEVVDDFRAWIAQGAVDPRTSTASTKQHGRQALSVAEAQQHWSFQPIRQFAQDELVESSATGNTAQSAIDRFISAKLANMGIPEAPSATPAALVRRLYFDLTGLPPTAEELQQWSADFDEQRYAELVDHLLASPHYGETFARHWMDVVRYADSVILRGFVHNNAWRYRDYLVDSYNSDRSFQEMIHEQVAGDLLTASDTTTRQRQLVATAFLALGNTNLETQDKNQLDMDFLDEQLEVIGAAFLGQTIGCARCHDHKFDPIPTRDYYALAGILKSAVGMKHSNVSEWIEQPLPVEQGVEEFAQLTEDHAKLTAKIQQLKKSLDMNSKKNLKFIEPTELPGIVVDSDQATLVGSWMPSSSVGNIVGTTYIHDKNMEKGQKSATFEPDQLPPGEYDVLLAYQNSDNRASNVVVKVFSADGEKEVTLNQRLPASELALWSSLGRYRFEANGQKYVLVSNSNTDGHVVVDAVLFLPVSQLKDGSLAATLQPGRSAGEKSVAKDELSQELKQLEGQLTKVQKRLDARPKYLTVAETGQGKDIAIHIRGDVHSLGEVVPRGFLTAINLPAKSGEAPDRLQLAYWLSDNHNPLTARVYANRIWGWLMGRAIVSTPNNFGTTGTLPSHPELLDYLARRLITSGWSTKTVVRDVVMSQTYRRSIVEPCSVAAVKDPDNQYLWRGQLRRISVESLRDAMLVVSGELDTTLGGSLIRPGTKSDYGYVHDTTRRSIYQPVFRNSLAELFNEFDFPNPSFSIDTRSRSTIAPQGLALMQEPWVTARAHQAAIKYASLIRSVGTAQGIQQLYLACFARLPNSDEQEMCSDFLGLEIQPEVGNAADATEHQVSEARLEQLIQALFSSVDFRFLD